MALSDEDKADLAKLISEEVARQVSAKIVSPGISPAAIDIRHVGIPIDTKSMRPPVAADQCCNGCD